ncbi:MAG: hypothetical protein ACXAC5_00105 [Promethearchaeota archaeon]|jgi:hypothetical protein
MAWFRTALSISTPDPGSYYTVLNPDEFYEWRYTQIAPKGAVFTVKLPPSDIFTEGKIIASAHIFEDKLQKHSEGFRLKENSPVEVKLQIGQMPSPRELLDKNEQAQKTFGRALDSFKQDLATRLYVDSQTEHPHLFRLSHWDEKNVTFHNFGRIKDLVEQFVQIRETLAQEVMDKTGRAHEMEEFRRYENAMTFMNNSHLHVDASKMDRLIETSGIKSVQTKTMPWKECFLEVSHGANILNDQISSFNSNKWVQSALSKNV